MMEELFRPTLQEESGLKSYRITNLFFITFFIGILPTIVLGTKNAKWLKVRKKYIYTLIILGIAIILSRIVLTQLMVNNIIGLTVKDVRNIYRILSVLLYTGYYFSMKEQYNIFLVTNGNHTPMLKDGIIWTIVTALLEGILILLGLFIIG